MKKYIYLTVFTIFCFSFVVQTHAVSDENVTKRRPDKPIQAQIQEIRQEMRSNVAERHANRLERRFKFYFERFTKIITRFQTRLDLLKSDGKDVTSIQTKLDSAKTKLSEAKIKGEAAVAAFRAIDPAKFSEQKAEALVARDLAKSARVLFQDTHKLLKDALKDLKVISKPALPASEESLWSKKLPFLRYRLSCLVVALS